MRVIKCARPTASVHTKKILNFVTCKDDKSSVHKGSFLCRKYTKNKQDAIIALVIATH